MLVVLLIAMLVGGCGDGGTRTENELFTVSVSKETASAARAKGVDLKRLVTTSADKAFALLPHRGQIRIDVEFDPDFVIPETGVGGFTDPHKGNVHIAVDPYRHNLREVLQTWVPPMVAHELHHSSRIRTGPGYGVTLGAALVSEGLADHFAYEVFPDTPPQPWDHALTMAQEHAVWLKAKLELKFSGYDQRSWFFGTGGVPRWAGYTLGYDIARRYLETHHRSASDAVSVNADDVIEGFPGF